MPPEPNRATRLRTELAVAAARLIAEEGCDYGLAKRRAVRELLGEGADARGAMPDNAEVEHELRRHLQLFEAETHPARLAGLRRIAADLMARLSDFSPHLVGSVLGGTATAHSDIELHLFTDSAKDVEVFLLNAGIEFDAEPGEPSERPAPLERLSFLVAAPIPGAPRIGVRVHVYARDAIRVAPRHRAVSSVDFDLHPVAASGRASLAALRQLIADSAP